LKFIRKQFIHDKTRKAQRGHWQPVDWRAGFAQKKCRALRVNRAGIQKSLFQIQRVENVESASVDEFTADAVARIVAGLENCDWSPAFPQRDA
jgi:nucleotidyltransferase/DNA polymerase involved in DNA repair